MGDNITNHVNMNHFSNELQSSKYRNNNNISKWKFKSCRKTGTQMWQG